MRDRVEVGESDLCGCREGPSQKTPPSLERDTFPFPHRGLGSRFDFGRGLDGGDLGGRDPPPSYVVGSDKLDCILHCVGCSLCCIQHSCIVLPNLCNQITGPPPRP